METKKETRGRKPLPAGKHKAPQSTMKINNIILPFVTLLKSNLKIGLVDDKMIKRLFNVLNGESNEVQTEVFGSSNQPKYITQCSFVTKKGTRCKNKVSHLDNLFNDFYVNSCENHYKTVINLEAEQQLKKGNL